MSQVYNKYIIYVYISIIFNTFYKVVVYLTIYDTIRYTIQKNEKSTHFLTTIHTKHKFQFNLTKNPWLSNHTKKKKFQVHFYLQDLNPVYQQSLLFPNHPKQLTNNPKRLQHNTNQSQFI